MCDMDFSVCYWEEHTQSKPVPTLRRMQNSTIIVCLACKGLEIALC